MSIDDATETLSEIISDRPLTYIIIDALDECEKETRQDLALALALARMLEHCTSLVKIFVSSRDDQDIKVSMDRYPEIKIQARDNKDDIRLYVENTVDRLILDRKLLPTDTVSDDLRLLIKERLRDGAQGM